MLPYKCSAGYMETLGQLSRCAMTFPGRARERQGYSLPVGASGGEEMRKHHKLKVAGYL